MKTRIGPKAILCLVLLLLSAGGWLVYRQDQQDRLRGPLIQAVLLRDTAGATRLLAQGADANVRDVRLPHRTLWESVLQFLHPPKQRTEPIWPTALMLAATGARFDRECSDYPEWRLDDRDGYVLAMPASPACIPQDQPALAQALLDHGADVNAAGPDGISALSIAYAWGNVKIVRLLLAHGAVPSATPGRITASPLLLAVSTSNVAQTAALLGQGADTHSPRTFLQDLVAVAASGDASNADATTDWAKTEKANEAIILLLLKHGAKINKPGDAGGLYASGPQTPLMVAVANHNTVLARFLLRQGADPNLSSPTTDYMGADMPLAEAVGSPPTVRLLLSHGADVNGGNTRKLRPLQSALFGSDTSPLPKAFPLLIAAGADVNRADTGGFTPLMFCRSHPGAALLLLAHRAKVNVSAPDGTTALMMASKGRGEPSGAATVRLLLAHGANPALRDAKGRTALLMASDPAVRSALLSGPLHR